MITNQVMPCSNMRLVRPLICVFLVILSLLSAAVPWSLEGALGLDPNSVCKRRAFGKSKMQSDFCRSRPDLIRKVNQGVQMAIGECQFQFRQRKWNCSTEANSLRKILNRDYRETAYLYSITAAGITFAVTRACTTKKLRDCDCKRKDEESFEWQGCGENVDYGYKIAGQVLDQGHPRDARSLLERHNNEAGRLSVQTYMRKSCKCHGLSRSCSTKTCWRKMPLFREVGDRLKDRFDGAIKVIIDNTGSQLMPEGSTIAPPTNKDLVYTIDSPSFCEPNPSTGSLGTHGRHCNPTSPKVGGCDLLCCSRGYQVQHLYEKENCSCSFHWCCEVSCKTCYVNSTIHICK